MMDMKTFWSMLAAILVAVIIVGLFSEIRSEILAAAARNERIAEIRAETTALNAKLDRDAKADAAFQARMEVIHQQSEKEVAEREKEAADLAAKRKLRNEKEEKEAADYRKTYRVPEPIYPTVEEAFASPTPRPST